MCIYIYNIYTYIYICISDAQLGGEGGGLPWRFLKIKKSALILEKNVLIVSILRLNLPFKILF